MSAVREGGQSKGLKDATGPQNGNNNKTKEERRKEKSIPLGTEPVLDLDKRAIPVFSHSVFDHH